MRIFQKKLNIFFWNLKYSPLVPLFFILVNVNSQIKAETLSPPHIGEDLKIDLNGAKAAFLV
jgi:hypothetical protein